MDGSVVEEESMRMLVGAVGEGVGSMYSGPASRWEVGYGMGKEDVGGQGVEDEGGGVGEAVGEEMRALEAKVSGRFSVFFFFGAGSGF